MRQVHGSEPDSNGGTNVVTVTRDHLENLVETAKEYSNNPSLLFALESYGELLGCGWPRGSSLSKQRWLITWLSRGPAYFSYPRGCYSRESRGFYYLLLLHFSANTLFNSFLSMRDLTGQTSTILANGMVVETLSPYQHPLRMAVLP